MEEQVQLADGSGLSRSNQISPMFLVRLLNRVLSESGFRAEFQSALPVVGWDGTLRYRGATPGLEGHLRGKTGTLNGVSNLSGYLTTADDLVVFSFLINNPTQPAEVSQAAQDQVLAGIYAALTQPEGQPAVVAEPAASPVAPEAPRPEPVKVVAAKVAPAPQVEPPLQPPPSSPKPKQVKP